MMWSEEARHDKMKVLTSTASPGRQRASPTRVRERGYLTAAELAHRRGRATYMPQNWPAVAGLGLYGHKKPAGAGY